jgi:hypothetical protein
VRRGGEAHGLADEGKGGGVQEGTRRTGRQWLIKGGRHEEGKRGGGSDGRHHIEGKRRGGASTMRRIRGKGGFRLAGGRRPAAREEGRVG